MGIFCAVLPVTLRGWGVCWNSSGKYARLIASIRSAYWVEQLRFVEMMLWRGSAHAFPSGEGGTASAVTEEVR